MRNDNLGIWRSRAPAISKLAPLAVAAILAACAPEPAPAASEPNSAAPAAAEETLHQPSEAWLQQMVQQDHFNGVALVTREGAVLHQRAYGVANADEPNRIDAAFHVGSLTKQFTAAAIMQLVEQGKIDLDASINDYLPEPYRPANWAPVHVRHLITHTAGMPDYAVTRDYYDVVDGWAFGETVEGMIREAMAKDLEFEPGSDFTYSNIGFTLLGEIIEEQSGQSYPDYIRDNLLEPIGMTNSLIHAEGHVPAPDEAAGLRWNEAESRHTKDEFVSLPVTSPDGGLITTLDDFRKWIAVYRDMSHPRLTRASIERMLQPSIPPGAFDWPEWALHGEASYGFGIATSADLVNHGGWIVGYRGHFIYDRDDDLLVAVVTNNTTNDPAKIAAGLFRLHEQ